LRCGHDLKLFLNDVFNDLCRAFEKELLEWRPRGKTFVTETSLDGPLHTQNGGAVTNVSTLLSDHGKKWHTCILCSTRRWYCLPPGKSPTNFNCADGRESKKVSWCSQTQETWIAGRENASITSYMTTTPPKREVECLKCGERRAVPNSVDMNDLPPDWNCSLRTWSMNPTKLGFDEFYGCNNGKINNSLIKAHAAVLATKRAEATEVVFERQIAAEEDVYLAHESVHGIVEAPVDEPLPKKQKRSGCKRNNSRRHNANPY
jgi:hypothetical protein